MTTHDLKVWPEYFAPLWAGTKTFEIRYDDRAYQPGDAVILREFDRTAACKCFDRAHATVDRCTKYTGRRIGATIGFLTSQTPARGSQPGFKGNGYVVFSLVDVALAGALEWVPAVQACSGCAPTQDPQGGDAPAPSAPSPADGAVSPSTDAPRPAAPDATMMQIGPRVGGILSGTQKPTDGAFVLDKPSPLVLAQRRLMADRDQEQHLAPRLAYRSETGPS